MKSLTKLSLMTSLLIAAQAFAATSTGPQLTGNIKIVRLDGQTVIQQGKFATSPTSMESINVAASDAFVTGNGRCAFNLRYEEISGTAVSNTTNRIFSNDTLIAQNTAISLVANTGKAVVTQPYLFAGANYVKFAINAEGKEPFTAWVKINVAGTCGSTAPTPPVITKPVTPKPPEVTPPKPTTPPVMMFKPGSAEWNKLFTAFGYSNYGVTQLKTKAYARYADLVKLNADLTAVVDAKQVEQGRYTSLMARWESFAADAAFRAALSSTAPGTVGVK